MELFDRTKRRADAGLVERQFRSWLQDAGLHAAAVFGAYGEERPFGKRDAFIGASVVVDRDVAETGVAAHFDGARADAAQRHARAVCVVTDRVNFFTSAL